MRSGKRAEPTSDRRASFKSRGQRGERRAGERAGGRARRKVGAQRSSNRVTARCGERRTRSAVCKLRNATVWKEPDAIMDHES